MSSTDTMMHSSTLFANQAEKTGSAHLTLSKAGKAYVYLSLSMLKIFTDIFTFPLYYCSVVPEVDLSTLVSSKPSGKTSSSKQHLPTTYTTTQASIGALGQATGFGGFSAVEPSSVSAVSVVSAVPVSRPKIAFGLSTKKGKLGGK